MRTIYAIRDRVANDLAGHAMYTLFVFRTDAQAVRYFSDAVFDSKSVLAAHPGDYELIACGYIDDIGQITLHSLDKPRIVLTGDALIAATTDHQPKLVKES